MNILFATVLGIILAAAGASMRPRGLRASFAVVSLLTGAWLAWLQLQAPGHALIPLLLLGVSLSGVVRGEASRILLLPIAFLLPLSVVIDGGARVAVHDVWRAAAYVVMGSGIGFALRFAWAVVQRSSRAWVRPAMLGLLMLCGPGMALGLLTPSHGARAWNVLLPMTTLEGASARIVALHEGTARAWPWLEPLSFALPVAIIALVLVLGVALFVRPSERRVQPLAWAAAGVVLVLFAAVAYLSAGALDALQNVDPAQVVQEVRPPFVPHDATTYLSPEENTWHMSRAALALWFGVGLWIAASALLAASPRQDDASHIEEHAAWAPMALLMGALLFAEAWSAQAVEVAAQRGTQGLIFALAAFAASAVLLRGRLRVVLCVLVGASSTLWLVATVAQKVVA